MDAVCALGLLSGKGRANGVTFLIPKDAKIRAELKKLVDSEKREEYQKASEILAAHVISDNLKTPADFKAKAAELSNALGRAIKVDVSKSSATEVVFANGAKATIASDFSDGSRRDFLNVYHLVGPAMPTDTEQKVIKIIRGQKTGKGEPIMGGYQVSKNQITENRFQLGLLVENEERLILQGRRQNNANAYLGTSAIFYRILIDGAAGRLANSGIDANEWSRVLNTRALPIYSRSIADFYLLSEPHGRFYSSEYYIPSNIFNYIFEHIVKNVSEIHANPSPVFAEVEKLLEGNVKYDTICFNSAAKNAFLDTIDEDRLGIINSIDTKLGITAVGEIKAKYDSLPTFRVNGKCVFPEELNQLYQSNGDLKRSQDLFRFSIFMKFDTKLGGSNYDVNDFNDAVEIIADIMHGDNKQFKFDNIDNASFGDTVREGLKMFVNSMHFLFVPHSGAELNKLTIKNTSGKPGAEELWNTLLKVQQRQGRLFGISADKVPEVDRQLLRSALTQMAAKNPQISEAVNLILNS